MHRGRAVELIDHLCDTLDGSQIWWARPLFVDDPTECEIVIGPHERCTALHTNAGRQWRPGPA